VGTVIAAPRRFQFQIDPKTPMKDLLPAPPKAKNAPIIAKDLAQVPEVEFQTPLAKSLPSEEALKQTAHQIAKINHLNGKKTDGFLEALVGQRHDLTGLPLAMGDACRTKGERSKQFAIEVGMVRSALGQGTGVQVFQVDFINALPISEAVPANSVQTPPPAAPSAGSAPQPAPTPAPQPAPAAPAMNPSSQPPPAIASGTAPVPQAQAVTTENGGNFWERYQSACAQEDKKLSPIDRAKQEIVTVTRIAALMQALAPESPTIRRGLVKYLSTISHVDATKALARLAIFSVEDEVRKAAIDVLKVRRERDYTDILLTGLRYPWPDVAKRAAEAVVKLERNDLVPKLVDLLDEPDPRAPVVKEVDNQKVSEVRELVRINHHRNCLLCHAPGNTGNVAAETLTAQVPVPSDPLPTPSQGYQTSLPDLLVRIDVTYLRQDFSMMQAVADANPWPEMQRFDFLVRTRTLSEKEAEEYREKLAHREPGRVSPYQRAALFALRELTGRDTEPTPEAWRRLLKLPAHASSVQ
jgi:hypothetical protein